MAGVKGRSGTNKGKDKPFAEALRMELAALGPDHKALREIARAVIAKATSPLDKDSMSAIREIADRLDGKAAQAIEMTGEMEHRYVARVPNKSTTADTWQQQHAPQTLQ
jgi:hypothetical protein